MAAEQRNHCQCREHKRLNRGFSDLASRNPVLAAQWDSERNGLPAANVDVGSHTKYWWICPAGHRFQSTPKQRMIGRPTANGCQQCYLDSPVDPHTGRHLVAAHLRPTADELARYFQSPRRTKHARESIVTRKAPRAL